MLSDDEFIEGKKAGKTDFNNKIKRDLTRYPSEHYKKGYNVQYASCVSAEKRKNKRNKKRGKK